MARACRNLIAFETLKALIFRVCLDNGYRKSEKLRDAIRLGDSDGLAGGSDRFAISFMAVLAV